MQWEVEALEPAELQRLVLAAVDPYIDRTVLAQQIAREEEQRRALADFLGGGLALTPCTRTPSSEASRRSQRPGCVLWLIGRVCLAEPAGSTGFFWHASRAAHLPAGDAAVLLGDVQRAVRGEGQTVGFAVGGR